MIKVKDSTVSPSFVEKMNDYLMSLGYLTGGSRGQRDGATNDPLGITVQFKSRNFWDRIGGSRFIHCYLSWDNHYKNITMKVPGRGKNDEHFTAMKDLAEKISAYFNQPVNVEFTQNDFEYDDDTQNNMRGI